MNNSRPKLIVILVTLLALSCDDGRSRSSGDAGPSELCNTFCNRLSFCGYFIEQYGDPCNASLCTGLVEQFEGEDDVCDDAVVEYFECNLDFTCRDLEIEPCPNLLATLDDECGQFLPTCNVADPFHLYFSQNGSGGAQSNVLRIDTRGGAAEILQSNLASPHGVAVDVQGGKVYWTDPGTDKIQRKNLNGSGAVEDLITVDLNAPHGIALDVVAGKMYFADRFGRAIKRANLDGTDVEILVEIFGSLPQNITLDLIHEKIYWSETAFGRINRSNLDGSGFETIVSGISSVTGVAVDPFNGFLYFANRLQQKIQRSDLNGANVQDVITGLAKSPLDLALDLDSAVIYWSFFDSIQRVDLALSGGVETVISGLAGSSGTSGVNGLSLGVVPGPCLFR